MNSNAIAAALAHVVVRAKEMSEMTKGSLKSGIKDFEFSSEELTKVVISPRSCSAICGFVSNSETNISPSFAFSKNFRKTKESAFKKSSRKVSTAMYRDMHSRERINADGLGIRPKKSYSFFKINRSKILE